MCIINTSTEVYLSELAFCCYAKHHEQKQGREGAYFILQLPGHSSSMKDDRQEPEGRNQSTDHRGTPLSG